MKRTTKGLLSLLVALMLPVAAGAAMDHGKMSGSDHDKMGGMDHGKMSGMDHGKMGSEDHGAHGDMMKGMEMMGEQSREGVKAMAHLKDVGEAMKKAGMDATHHVAVMFEDQSGKPVTEGQAAVKITGPDGKTSEPVKLVGMDGHFGADVALKQKGEYKFEVGTKLADGKTRQYEFKQTVK